MGWDRGRYYTRSKKVNGRVVREYIGGGHFGQVMAKLDAYDRQIRYLEALGVTLQVDELTDLDAEFRDLCAATDLVARAALLAAGLHQHHRGSWRKRREQVSA